MSCKDLRTGPRALDDNCEAAAAQTVCHGLYKGTRISTCVLHTTVLTALGVHLLRQLLARLLHTGTQCHQLAYSLTHKPCPTHNPCSFPRTVYLVDFEVARTPRQRVGLAAGLKPLLTSPQLLKVLHAPHMVGAGFL